MSDAVSEQRYQSREERTLRALYALAEIVADRPGLGLTKHVKACAVKEEIATLLADLAREELAYRR